MSIKQILDEFQSDWAAMPQAEEKQLKRLNNKTIVISGHNLARCICYALLFQNEENKLNNRVIFLGNREDLGDNYTSLITGEDFVFTDFSSADEISRADYIIHTGMCCEKSGRFPESFKEEIKRTEIICSLAKKCSAKVILFSDSRVIGKAEEGRVYSENEYSSIGNISPAHFDNQLLRIIESSFFCAAKQYGFDLTVLRAGIILGAHSGISTFLDDAFLACATGKSAGIVKTRKKYSFISLTDVLIALFEAMTALEPNNVYNLAIPQPLSPSAIAAKLFDIYGAEIDLADGVEESFCALHTGKLETAGFNVRIDIDTAIELCVMGYRKDTSDMVLPNTHDGRLDKIQKIQLALLKEVERICRKHEIKYFLGGGTLLGAVRHGGFIPWDDDSDIMMDRDNYERFLSVAQSELRDGFTLQTAKTDKHCFYEFSKIRVDGTVFATGFSREHKEMHNGIALDIFCHDKTADSAFGRKLHMAMTVFTRALVFNKWNRRKTENGGRFQRAVTNFCVRLFPLRFSFRMMNKTISFFKNKKNARYLYDGMGRNVYRGAFPAEWLDRVIYMDFEDTRLPVPEDYGRYLEFLYGDYMSPAPISTRLGCHVIPLCDIGEYDSVE